MIRNARKFMKICADWSGRICKYRIRTAEDQDRSNKSDICREGDLLQMKNVREMLDELMNGMAAITDEDVEFMKQFSGLQKKAFEDSALPGKTKELIAVAIALYSRCEYCIVYHVYNAYAAGASRDEILDAAKVAAGGFGGGPSLAYASTLLMASVDEFEKDF